MSSRPHSLATFTQIVVRLASYAVTEVDSAHRKLERTKQQLDENMRELEQRTDHFIECGWADLRDWHSMPIHPYSGGYGHPCWSWEQYFRHLCKDMHRPFIYVVKYYTGKDVELLLLHIPKRKSLHPLSTNFFLLDNQKLHNTVAWRWLLTKEQFAWWCAAIRTDPDMHRAMWDAHSRDASNTPHSLLPKVTGENNEGKAEQAKSA